MLRTSSPPARRRPDAGLGAPGAARGLGAGPGRPRRDAGDHDRYPDVTAVVTVRDAFGAPVGGLNADAFRASAGRRSGASPRRPGGRRRRCRPGRGHGDGHERQHGRATPWRRRKRPPSPSSTTCCPTTRPPSSPSPTASARPASSPATSRRWQRPSAASRRIGATALYDAVVAGVRTAAAAPLPRKVVVLLTDGQDYGARSSATEEQSLTEAATAGVPVFTIGVGRRHQRPLSPGGRAEERRPVPRRAGARRHPRRVRRHRAAAARPVPPAPATPRTGRRRRLGAARHVNCGRRDGGGKDELPPSRRPAHSDGADAHAAADRDAGGCREKTAAASAPSSG